MTAAMAPQAGGSAAARPVRPVPRVRGLSAGQERKFARRLMTLQHALTGMTGWDHKGAAARLLEAVAQTPDLIRLEDEALGHAMAWLTATRCDAQRLEDRTGAGLILSSDQRDGVGPWRLQLVPDPAEVRRLINQVVHARVHRSGNVAEGDTFVCQVGDGAQEFGHTMGHGRGAIWGYYAVAMQPPGVPAFACVLTREECERARRAHEAPWHRMWQQIPHRLHELDALRQLLPALQPQNAAIVPAGNQLKPLIDACARAEPMRYPPRGLDVPPKVRAVLAVQAWAYGIEPWAPFASWADAAQYVLPGTPGVHFNGHAGTAVQDVPQPRRNALLARIAELPPARRAAATTVERALRLTTLRHDLEHGVPSSETAR